MSAYGIRCIGEKQKMKTKQIKNVIFIIADTLRAQNVGLYGASPSPTPNIDKLGEKGIVFFNAYATITKTDPSITSIMSGQYPLSIGLVNHGKNIRKEEEENIKSVKFLPEIAQRNGYKTAAIDWLSRWHKRGYDYYSGRLLKNSNFNPLVIAGNKSRFFNHLSFYLRVCDQLTTRLVNRDFFLRLYYSLFSSKNTPYDPADIIVKKAISVLEKNKNNKLFLYLHFWDCHRPYTQTKGLWSYVRGGINEMYNEELRFLDTEFGKLIEFLRINGQFKNTLIVFTGDHGENFFEHDAPFSHEGLYDDVVRIPLIFYHPDFTSRKINSLVQHVDILPTVLDALGITIPRGIDGESLTSLMLKEKEQTRNSVYFEDILFRRIKMTGNIIRRRGVKVGDYKYIETLCGRDKELHEIYLSEDTKILKKELYNLRKDPFEKRNIVDKKDVMANKFNKRMKNFIFKLNYKRLQNDEAFKVKIEKSIKVIKDALLRIEKNKIALAWTGGKDSTVLLHLVRIAFGGRIPFKVIFNDSTMEFKEIHKFIEKVSRLWDIDLITIKHSEGELEQFHKTNDYGKKKELSRIMKITAINQALKKYKIKAFMAGIRWDEHESRSREKYFSPRPDHMRIHPILHFTEKDIWKYIKHFGVPYVDLYSKGYRSLGEKPFTKKAKPGEGERSGRERDKEELMSRLRRMGYW